ncbi:Hypothetical predicted protein [Cloeon dipterum]|uniref:Uncharacterized protein n=3 Tax=Cloeon dipterum TaxID=197152 RepID=A0A8S1DSK2_9INSE|nr:Hypothetical predicted protein [Cloeon dipterum]
MNDKKRFKIAKSRSLSIQNRQCDPLDEVISAILSESTINSEKIVLDVGKQDESQRYNALKKLMKQKYSGGNGCWGTLDNIFNALEVLLSPIVEEIDLTDVMSFSPDYFKQQYYSKAMQLIQTKAPRVLTLKSSEEFFIDQQIVDPIVNLKCLTNLDFQKCSMKYLDLMKVCTSLPSLKSVNVQIFFESDFLEDVEVFKESFSNLEYLICSLSFDFGLLDKGDNIARLFWRRCMENLLNLKGLDISGKYAKLMTFTQSFDAIVPGKSNLETLKCMPNTLKMHLLFPEVNDLEIFFSAFDSTAAIKNMLLFPKSVQSLKLRSVSLPQVVDIFLAKYGPHCTSLMIEAREEMIYSYKRIFSNCPKLERLTLYFLKMTDDGSNITFHKNCDALTKFSLFPPRGSFAKLSNILTAAPNLQHFTLISEWCDLEDLQILSSLIEKKRKILQNLVSFSFIGDSTPRIPMSFMHQPEFAQLVSFSPVFCELLKNAIAFLPKLKNSDVRFTIEDSAYEYFKGLANRMKLPPSKALLYFVTRDKTLNDYLEILK